MLQHEAVFIRGISSRVLGQGELCFLEMCVSGACLCCPLRTGKKQQFRTSCFHPKPFNPSLQLLWLLARFLGRGPGQPAHTCMHTHVYAQKNRHTRRLRRGESKVPSDPRTAPATFVLFMYYLFYNKYMNNIYFIINDIHFIF